MSEKVIVLHPVLSISDSGGDFSSRDPDRSLEEAEGLAAAIKLDVVFSDVIRLSKFTPATLIGSGIVDRIKEFIKDFEAGLVFVDHTLTPVQQRNLEEAWDCKVMDRTGLILEIFGARARTKEGRLQVELAALNFQRSRLVKLWTHLERQRGGLSKVGGPGETQKELDRRMLDDRVRRLKEDLEAIRKNRSLQRESRKREPYPVVALVGYTNAGKSTLFNRVTGAEVFVEDLLFATLDTTMRAIEMPSGQKAILSDTVGFISDLPTNLVAAFRATLEEVQEAAVILHIRDVAQADTEAEKLDVEKILRDLGVDAEREDRVIEVFNKIDALPDDERKALITRTKRNKKQVAISALTGEGMAELMDTVDAYLCRDRRTVYVDVDITDGKALSWLYSRGRVLKRSDDEEQVHLKIALAPEDCDRFAHQFTYKLKKTAPRKKPIKKSIS